MFGSAEDPDSLYLAGFAEAARSGPLFDPAPDRPWDSICFGGIYEPPLLRQIF